MSSNIVIVGSLNMDMVVSVNRRPNRGETVSGNDFFMSPGGKGANQAFAARKLGASVSMIGKLGADSFGDQLLRNLEHIGVEIAGIEQMPQHSTGIAMISVDPEGDNSIIVAPGANQWFTPMDVRRYEDLIKHAKLLMVQLEIPLETVMEAVKLAKQYNVPVLLDPAPAQLLSDELLAMVDYIVPNESEIAELTGIEVSDVESAIIAANELLKKGVTTVFAKLGDKGVVVVNAARTYFIEAYKVISVDSTAAGDAFAGAVGAALVSGKDVWQAADFASAIGAMTVTKPGAQSSIPDLKEAELFIKKAENNKVYPN
jgi:ribokinase